MRAVLTSGDDEEDMVMCVLQNVSEYLSGAVTSSAGRLLLVEEARCHIVLYPDGPTTSDSLF